jgi:hypothetical protein
MLPRLSIPPILPRYLPKSIARTDTPATGPSRRESELDTALGGPDKRTLFITSGNHLWSVPLK